MGRWCDALAVDRGAPASLSSILTPSTSKISSPTPSCPDCSAAPPGMARHGTAHSHVHDSTRILNRHPDTAFRDASGMACDIIAKERAAAALPGTSPVTVKGMLLESRRNEMPRLPSRSLLSSTARWRLVRAWSCQPPAISLLNPKPLEAVSKCRVHSEAGAAPHRREARSSPEALSVAPAARPAYPCSAAFPRQEPAHATFSAQMAFGAASGKRQARLRGPAGPGSLPASRKILWSSSLRCRCGIRLSVRVGRVKAEAEDEQGSTQHAARSTQAKGSEPLPSSRSTPLFCH